MGSQCLQIKEKVPRDDIIILPDYSDKKSNEINAIPKLLDALLIVEVLKNNFSMQGVRKFVLSPVIPMPRP